MGKTTISMAMFNSYVSLSEATQAHGEVTKTRWRDGETARQGVPSRINQEGSDIFGWFPMFTHINT